MAATKRSSFYESNQSGPMADYAGALPVSSTRSKMRSLNLKFGEYSIGRNFGFSLTNLLVVGLTDGWSAIASRT
jgi:hypothetical protein